MNLFLIRHSIAERPSPSKSDLNRELTSEGINLILKSSKFLKMFVPDLELILSSPYIRAFQTAEIISNSFDNKVKLIKENNLAAGCSTSSLIEVISCYDEQNIAVVGHQPDISNHISNLTSNGNVNLVFRPATIAKIIFESRIGYGRGILEILIPSEVII